MNCNRFVHVVNIAKFLGYKKLMEDVVYKKERLQFFRTKDRESSIYFGQISEWLNICAVKCVLLLPCSSHLIQSTSATPSVFGHCLQVRSGQLCLQKVHESLASNFLGVCCDLPDLMMSWQDVLQSFSGSSEIKVTISPFSIKYDWSRNCIQNSEAN